MQDKALLGLISGVTLVVATLIGVALVSTPPAAGAVSGPRGTAAVACPHDRKPAEQGYGVAISAKCTAG